MRGYTERVNSDPRQIRSAFEAVNGSSYEGASQVAPDKNPVGVILDVLVAAVNDIEDSVRNLADRIEPVLTPANCVPGSPQSQAIVPASVRTNSALSESIQGQRDRLMELSGFIRRLSGRVEL